MVAKTDHLPCSCPWVGHTRIVITERTPVARRALLVEDTTPVRTLLAATLEGAGFEVVACASSSEALKSFGRFDPDVLIADIDLGDRPNGVELATILRARAPYLGVVFVTNFPSLAAFERTIPPPPHYAFLQKDLLDSADRLIEVVNSALDDSVKSRVIAGGEGDRVLDRLTPMQMEILGLIAAGFTNAEIAQRRGSSLRAVERLVTRVFEVLGLNDDPQHNPRVVATNLYTQALGYPAREAAR